MKHKNIFQGAFILLLVLFISCVDDAELLFQVDKPASIEAMEYLNGYGALKSHVDRSAHPGFKLGAGVVATDYIKQGLVYRFINANFDDVTAGNLMKYSSSVSDDGSMNFSQVVQFVEAAKAAGISIYGHTLLWHAQQNNKYLNSILADREIEIDPSDANNALHMKTPEPKANTWDWQIYYDLAEPLTTGVAYTLKMRVFASEAFTMDFWPTDGSNVKYGLAIPVSDKWAEVIINWTAEFAANRLQFCFGKFGGDLYFDDISFTASGSEENLIPNGSFDEDDLTGWGKPGWHGYSYSIVPLAAAPTTWWTNLVSNSDCEDNDLSSFFATESRDGPKAATFGATGTGAGGIGRSIVVQAGDNPVNNWDTQFFVKVPHVFETGDSYRFSMKIKADKPAPSESQAHKNPGEYLHWSMVGSPNFTTQWQEYSNSGVISADQNGMSTIAFNLAVFKEANTYYFDDICFEIEESGNKIPLTPEEKADTLTRAMENWIAGMMEACDGYVTAWDVVNEPLSGSDLDGDGLYDLQSVKNVSESDAQNNFYWQDYLGDNYVRVAVELARRHGPPEMKLFVNDYNLESDWDDNQKLKSLIKWIEKWESDATTVIDGIGTQMHISYYENPAMQASKEEHIVKMFQLLAETGKLIKITELDMGLVNEEGHSIPTEMVTEEQHKAMSSYYKFIIQKYFEIIPAAQQFGITHWCPTDSPKDSAWRAGQPVGLWTEKYSRKHTYAGYADGLSGK
ncbi:endo-1,4-beta-xylanase [Proteiniphilum sp. X52]|uniref:endo-1,4-beta-xylanase n=1 Tax=Proteiniphilum sp. X52 TaxID=2382159 RepID=UPI000F0A72E7|nr:endo-1,4-beta-xylanase [Proteiniphilum sp. X52]RNC65540.1 glycosyl hydrolase family 10 [Proteiniphilum sp. X52]